MNSLFVFVIGLSFSIQSASVDGAPHGYDLVHTHSKYTFRYSVAGEPVRRGNKSERFEVGDAYC
jgi:hypothetical protein